MDEELLAKVKKAAIIGSFFGVSVLFAFLRWPAALKVYVVLVGLFATLAILIQSGKGGGLAASLGGLGGESLLGVHSASPIAKATYLMLALFLFNCMLIAIIGPVEHAAPGLSQKAGTPAAQQPAPTAPEGSMLPPLQLPSEQPAGTTPAAPAAPASPAEKPATETPAASATPAAPETPATPAPSTQPGGTPQP